jgi:carbon-monoxide dehydrogenase medium subunit
MLCAAVVAAVEDGKVSLARIAMGPVAPTPARATGAEDWLRGQAATRENMDLAAELAADQAQPRSSALRGSREFRKRMVRVLVRRALCEACGIPTA